ncbi:hypothetical protein ACIQF6_28585 [Kitasatospora sp. NPDC092948]|uniref:hypothetical protein n=1 Tax=Kitasatospora sp. NPDC092948 TaxID=3364088 RepID=UPI00380E8EA3
MTFQHRPLANGTRTHHPVPDLPFVDDSHLPLDEGPEAIEAVGRHEGSGTWGRYDTLPDGGWHAFTTDPLRPDLGWSIRFHPEHGQTVLLMSDSDIASMHSEWDGPQLLFRAGGYWWDGTTWYRPGQIWHPVHHRHEFRKASAPTTITAADLLDTSTGPGSATIVKVTDFAPAAEPPSSWLDQLALWAQIHHTHPGARPLDRCVVNLASPELAADHLIGAPDLAAMAGISASTLRSYIARDENDVPMPQATISGRNLWSRPVGADWVEARNRSAEGVEAILATDDEHPLSPLQAEVRDRYTARFLSALRRPSTLKRWSLRHRGEEAIKGVATELAWNVAVTLNDIVPTDLFSATLRHAILDEFTTSVQRHQRGNHTRAITPLELAISRPVAKTLDWFIRFDPSTAQSTLGNVQHEAAERLGISAGLSAEALRRSLVLDSKIDEATRNQFLDRALARDEPA